MLKRFGILPILLLLVAFSTQGQGLVSGQETTIKYSGTNVPIVPPNTPASQFFNGLNTFIIPVSSPSVSLRVFVTNNTANACNAFTVQLWASSDPQTSQFAANLPPVVGAAALANWQVVPLQSAAGTLVQNLSISIPGSGAAYFDSTGISSPKVALQLVNASNTCATTNIEVTATVVTVSKTTPLISANGPGVFNSSIANQIQGLVPQQVSAQNVNPVITGGIQPPINSGSNLVGIDNFTTSIQPVTSGTPSVSVFPVPTPSTSGEFAVAIEATPADNSTSNILPPFACFGSLPGGCAGGLQGMSVAPAQNITAGQAFKRTFTNPPGNENDIAAIVLSSSSLTSIRQANVIGESNVGTASNVNFSVNTAANSTLLVAFRCTANVTCPMASVTDTQGHIWALLTQNFAGNANQAGGLVVWYATTLSTAAADTITFTTSTGTVNAASPIELSGTSPAQLTAPAISDATDPIGAELVRTDALSGNQFNCNVTISTATTTQCQPAPTTINGVPVRLYVTDIQVNTTTAGAGSAIQLVDGNGSNCATATANLSAITYSGSNAVLQSFLGMRTPFVVPLQTAMCVKQTGAAPSTSVVEVRGFLAP